MLLSLLKQRGKEGKKERERQRDRGVAETEAEGERDGKTEDDCQFVWLGIDNYKRK